MSSIAAFVCVDAETRLLSRYRATDNLNIPQYYDSVPHSGGHSRESKKLSGLLFFQFIYTKVGVEQVRHFST
jgi:hypothetical protein